MGTSCDGFTSTSNKLKATDYWRDTWGLSWQWYDAANVDFNFCTTITDARQVYMFSATGPWDSFVAERLPGRAAALQSGGQPGAVGHSVAAYGYDKSNSTLLICLGWGYGFSDRWISVDPYTDRYATYVTKFAARADELAGAGRPAVAALPPDAGAQALMDAQGGRRAAAVSFAADIVPLFRPIDINHMKPLGVLLDDYTYMSDPSGDGTYPDHANTRQVYDNLTGNPPPMPPGGPYWTSQQLQLFSQWMAGGFQP